ncbi:hypothetical protein RHGRI_007494 [Rhododendron griersonianum]|uniref:Ubiquitin-like protease family profile domain-containing protein n=1 Tax=Rhododendron griersonianum TaxID=479676 RepID=A0AAV6KYC3_9ERIC|nr:hypothetical protein RHGRI_007494 [Rhododendron griersonianum]
MLKERARATKGYPSRHIFSPDFASNLLAVQNDDHEFSNVLGVDCDPVQVGYDVLKCDMLFLPVLQSEHWYCVCISLVESRIYILDSMKHTAQNQEQLKIHTDNVIQHSFFPLRQNIQSLQFFYYILSYTRSLVRSPLIWVHIKPTMPKDIAPYICQSKSPGPLKQNQVQKWIYENHLSFVGLVETKVRLNNLDATMKLCLPSHWNFLHNIGTGVVAWVFVAWDTSCFTVTLMLVDEQCITCRIQQLQSLSCFYISVVYGFNRAIARRALWHELKSLYGTIVRRRGFAFDLAAVVVMVELELSD